MALPASGGLMALDIDPNDFATRVAGYIPGTGVPIDVLTLAPFDDPNAALGRPTIDTTGNGLTINPSEQVPVVPVHQPFRHFELVTVGNDGQLTLEFNHPVADDENNPYGIDFIVFGNATDIIDDGTFWENGDPTGTGVSGDLIAEPGIVSVSQEGNTWHTFSEGPWADGFAPTLGRMFDPNLPDTELGDWNQWWSDPTNPTLPLDPDLSAGDFTGKTVAQIAQAYGASAGGTGFDLADVDLAWIRFVRIEDRPESVATSEIDAVADVAACGDYRHGFPAGDFNGDCRVNVGDLAFLGAQENLAELAENWLNCTFQCD